MVEPYFSAEAFNLYHGDCNQIIPDLSEQFDMVFADPPYFLSNDGLTINSGKIVSVNKGDWDKLGAVSIDEFNFRWIHNVRKVMKPGATIWISGTMHNIYSVYKVLVDLDFKILNSIVWEKSNPPPNFSCRVFTHSTEFIIWARKSAKIPHYYNYDLMREINGGKQMKDVWKLPAIAPWEKTCGKHPTQKPLGVLNRIILASTKQGDMVLDPFSGSGTTGLATSILTRRYCGIEIEKFFLDLSICRFNDLMDKGKKSFHEKLN